ncbi:phosphatidylinositol-glycan biosynthesis class F protein-like [Clytia hemisphaerica]|uniref:Phosphatidylinositol-glycan biosynthesis class F protein n=1 Tax=Clytia hemisphaerica TaxID=252671 RepID=A0A7M5WUB1_9CNID
MEIKEACLSYSIVSLVYQITIITIMYLCNISPISSKSITTFLMVFIPLSMIGCYVLIKLLHSKVSSIKKRKDSFSEVMLLVFTLASFLAGSVLFHVVSILLGAPLIENVEETFSLSMLCSALTVVPLFITHDGRWDDFLSYLPETTYVQDSLSDCIKMVSAFTVIGAWAGAFPIPLDWDRDWQTWPITCCIGALSGQIVGLCFSILSCAGIIPSSPPNWKNKIT